MQDGSRRLRALGALFLATCAACAATGDPGAAAPRTPPPVIDVVPARMPFDAVDVTWKERLALRYAYRQLSGDYRGTRAALAELRGALARRGLRAAGPAFALFYDDPGAVPAAELRSRVCVPVDGDEATAGPWAFDVLPGDKVVYCVTAADHGAVALSYPALFRYLAERGWVEVGPVREIYLTEAGDGSTGPPLTEVQVPWSAR